jgi:predicted ATPase
MPRKRSIRKSSGGTCPGPYIESIELDRTRIQDPMHYVFQVPAIRTLSILELHPRVTFFVGENGSGKSTLLEAIAASCGLNTEGGSRNMVFSTHAEQSPLGAALRSRKFHGLIPDAWFLRAESLFNVATQIEALDEGVSVGTPIINSYGGKSLHAQSHGESFMSLFANRFKQGLYLLDEPEAALSPQRQLEFLALLDILVENDSQLIIATHSPILMAYPKSTIYVFSEAGIEETEYKKTEHYQVTKQFLDYPDRMLRHLLTRPKDDQDGERA